MENMNINLATIPYKNGYVIISDEAPIIGDLTLVDRKYLIRNIGENLAPFHAYCKLNKVVCVTPDLERENVLIADFEMFEIDEQFEIAEINHEIKMLNESDELPFSLCKLDFQIGYKMAKEKYKSAPEKHPISVELETEGIDQIVYSEHAQTGVVVITNKVIKTTEIGDKKYVIIKKIIY